MQDGKTAGLGFTCIGRFVKPSARIAILIPLFLHRLIMMPGAVHFWQSLTDMQPKRRAGL